jgi:uncharacterized protein (TIGR04255 family)
MTAREVYPNAPVVVVACEIRHDHSEPLDPSAQESLRSELSDEFPLVRPIEQTRTVLVGPPEQAPTETVRIPRFTSRDQRTSATFGTDAIVLETTNHKNFEYFLSLLERIVKARLRVRPDGAILRVGVRYIDEIRVPDLPQGARGWDEWIDARLTGPASLSAPVTGVIEHWQGLAVFNRAAGLHLTLRYGAREGYAVPPGGALPRLVPVPGPFFLLDFDSYWEPESEAPSIETERVLQLATELHDPIAELFDSITTDRLKREVLRNA